MAFTEATITHTFKNADGTASSGQIQFTLTKRITNGNETITPSTITANLDASGKLSVVLKSNVDTGTLPEDSEWRMDWRILGAEPETFTIVVPSGGGVGACAPAGCAGANGWMTTLEASVAARYDDARASISALVIAWKSLMRVRAQSSTSGRSCARPSAVIQ